MKSLSVFGFDIANARLDQVIAGKLKSPRRRIGALSDADVNSCRAS